MKWFKFYGQDFLTDSKLSALNPFQRLIWVVLLCVASQDDKKTGILKFLEESRLVELAGLNYEDMESMYGTKRGVTLETFCNMGLVTRTDTETLHVTNYYKRQTQQSTSSERVAEWRARKKGLHTIKENVTNVTNVTLQSNGRIDKNRIDIPPYPPRGGVGKNKKPYYDGLRMTKVGEQWRILTEEGWKDFAGAEEKIEWR